MTILKIIEKIEFFLSNLCDKLIFLLISLSHGDFAQNHEDLSPQTQSLDKITKIIVKIKLLFIKFTYIFIKIKGIR